VTRLKELAQLKSLTVTVISVSLQPFIMCRLKQPQRNRRNFIAASNGKKEASQQTKQHSNSISIFVKFSLPGRKENNFCSRKFAGEEAEFGETALEQLKFDNDLLDSWWGSSIQFSVYCRQVGQKDSVLLGSASLGLKHLLIGDTAISDGRSIILHVYAAQGLFHQLQISREERKETVGSVCVSFKFGTVGSKSVSRSRTVSPQAPVRDSILEIDDGNEVNKVTTEGNVEIEGHYTQTDQSLSGPRFTLRSRTVKSVYDGVSDPVYALLQIHSDKLTFFSNLRVRWWNDKQVEGEEIVCLEQVLWKGQEGRAQNRQSVSRMLENCLVVEVWLDKNLIGIARIPTSNLARDLKEWNGSLVTAFTGNVEVVGIVDGNILGALYVSLDAGTENHLKDIIGSKRFESLARLCDSELILKQASFMDKETMTVVDRETMTDFVDLKTNNYMNQDDEVIELLTDGYDTPDSSENDQISEDLLDKTTCSGTSLGEHPPTVVPSSSKDRFKVEIIIEEGRLMSNHCWVYCSLPSGHTSLPCQSLNPKWNLNVHDLLSNQYLNDSQTQLIIRVWSSNSGKIDSENDQMLGFTAVDLRPLSSLPQLSGWYNILSWVGKCKGQLKVSVKPLEKLLPRELDSSNILPHPNALVSETNENYFVTNGTYKQFPSHLVQHTDQIIMHSKPKNTVPSIPDDNNVTHEVNWTLPTTNFLPPDPSRSFIETSLDKNLTELDQLMSKIVSTLDSDSIEMNTSQGSCSNLTFIVNKNQNPDVLSMSMVNSTISNQLDSIKSLVSDQPRPSCQHIPHPSLNLNISTLNLEEET